MPKKKKAAPRNLWKRATPEQTEEFRKAIEKKLGIKRPVRVSKKAVTPSLLEAAKDARAVLINLVGHSDKEAAGDINKSIAALNAAIAAHEPDISPVPPEWEWPANIKPCVFRFQGSERHTWCECGMFEGMTGNYPDRAEHKRYWKEHRDDRARAIMAGNTLPRDFKSKAIKS